MNTVQKIEVYIDGKPVALSKVYNLRMVHQLLGEHLKLMELRMAREKIIEHPEYMSEELLDEILKAYGIRSGEQG